MSSARCSLVLLAMLFSAVPLHAAGAAHTGAVAQLGRRMLSYSGVNGAAYARPANFHCLVGPGCGESNRESQQTESSPQPGPRGGRHLSEVTDAGVVGASDQPSDELAGRQLLQVAVNGASYVHSGHGHCLVGPGCGGDNRESEQNRESRGSPDPTPQGRRLSEE